MINLGLYKLNTQSHLETTVSRSHMSASNRWNGLWLNSQRRCERQDNGISMTAAHKLSIDAVKRGKSAEENRIRMTSQWVFTRHSTIAA
jgi:hypothetical protein